MQSKLDIKIEETKNGKQTAKVNGYYLHSKYDPINEAKRFAAKHYKPEHLHILFGTGMGYIAEELKKSFRHDERLVCIEPIIELKVRENCYDILIQNYSEDDIENILSNLISFDKNVTVICSPNYDKIFQNEFSNILKKIKDLVNLNKVFENTLKRFAKDWHINYLHNIWDIERDGDIEELYKKINYPIVVASGGPSLTKQIPLLKEYRNKFILVSSGSTINTLLHFGIAPDFAISIDAGENNYKHFEGKKFKNIKLVYSLFNHYKIKKCFEDEVYHFITQDSAIGVEKHYHSIFNKAPVKLSGGATVASYALGFARYISNSPIAIIGQDLAYTDNKSHAEYNKNFTLIDEKSNDRGLFYIDGYYGEKVLTDYSLYSMKKTFEAQISQLDFNEIIFNCTEGGAKIEGFNQLSFKEFCERYALNDVRIEKSYNNKKINKMQIIQTLENDIEVYNQLLKLAEENLSLLKKVQNKRKFTEKIDKLLDKNDKKMNAIIKNSPISLVIHEFALEILKNFSPKKEETQNEIFNRVFQKNYYLYSKIKETVTETINLTKELINQK